MKVYVVFYGWSCEGDDEDSLCVFADKAKAEAYRDAYKDALSGVSSYDYGRMLEREVE